MVGLAAHGRPFLLLPEERREPMVSDDAREDRRIEDLVLPAAVEIPRLDVEVASVQRTVVHRLNGDRPSQSRTSVARLRSPRSSSQSA